MKHPKTIACEIPELADGVTRQRIQVFPHPDDYVHPASGPFALTRDHLDEFAADLNASDRVVIDRDHAFRKGLPAPAAGWFVPGTAESSDNGVTAEVEWTADGADDVQHRRYRFISPEFSFTHRDAQGRQIPEPKIVAATITNRPFFTSMEPIAAEDLPIEAEILVAETFGDDVADTLPLIAEDAARALIAAAMTKVGAKPGDAAHTAGTRFADPGYQKDGKKRYALDNEKEVRAAWSYINQAKNAAKYTPEQLSRIKARIKRAMKKLGATIGADETGGDMDLTALAEAAGLAADASEEQVLEAWKTIAAERDALKAKAETGPTDEHMRTLIASAAKGEKAANELNEMKRDTLISACVGDGRITAAETSHYEAFWALDPDGTAKLLAEKSPALPFRPMGSEATTVPVMGADGKPIAALAADGGTLAADLAPQMIDGVPTPVDEDTAKIHAAAVDLLTKRGKPEGSYTEDEYVAACMEASTIVGISL